jgi:hypothetical protein
MPWYGGALVGARDRENGRRTGGPRSGVRPASAGDPRGVRGLQGFLGAHVSLGMCATGLGRRGRARATSWRRSILARLFQLRSL